MDFRYCLRFAVAIGLLVPPVCHGASQDKEARVTRVVHDVQLVAPDAAAHIATANESVSEGTTVRTGRDSRAEITFGDEVIMRLGANSVFNFKDGARNLILEEGSLLLQVPDSAKSAKINSGGIAAVVAGTTIVLESRPTHYKFLVLEGMGRLYRPGHLGDSILVRSGQMVFGRAKAALSDPIDFDIGRFVKTCRFITDFSPLRSAPLLASEMERQQRQKSDKKLIDTNLVIFGGGTLVSLVDPAQAAALDRGTSTPAPMPSPATSSSPTSSLSISP